MLNRSKLLVAAAITMVAFTAAATNAPAAEFSVANGGMVRAISSGKVTFTLGSTTIACNLTLELNLLTGPIAKVEGARFGTATNAQWANCEGTEVLTVLGLPWDLVYDSIVGTLPSGVTTVNLTVKNAQFLLTAFGGFSECLYAGDVASALGVSLVRGTTDRYTTGTLRTRETPRQRLVRGTFGCPTEGSMTGTFTLSPTQTLTRI
jgi:hypothetical protein